MEFNAEILKLIISQGIFAVLFVWLFYDTRKEAREREEKLMTQLDKTNQDHKLIIESINKCERSSILEKFWPLILHRTFTAKWKYDV